MSPKTLAKLLFAFPLLFATVAAAGEKKVPGKEEKKLTEEEQKKRQAKILSSVKYYLKQIGSSDRLSFRNPTIMIKKMALHDEISTPELKAMVIS